MTRDRAARGGGVHDAVPDLPRSTWWTRLWEPFWTVPMAIIMVAFIAGVVLPELDSALVRWVPFVFEGGPDGARSLLATIASAMISVTGLVFSITLVVLQLASSQFTPRILGGFLQSRIVQVTLGVFTASFVYALTVMRAVRDSVDGADGFVPQIAVTVAFVLVSAAVAMFIAFINHVTSSIQLTNVVAALGNQTTELARRTFPAADADRSVLTWQQTPGDVVLSVDSDQRAGHVTTIDHRGLVALADKHEVVIDVVAPIGIFLTEGQVLARVHSTPETSGELDLDELRSKISAAVWIDRSRTLQQDVSFGLRQLVDIAERALSPGVNDPTTATQVLDQIHRILREVVTRREPPSVVGEDRARLIHRPPCAAEIIRLAVEEINHYGAESLQVPRRLETMFDDLLTVALPEHMPALERAHALIAEARD